MNTFRSGRNVEREEFIKTSFCESYKGSLDEEYYQKEAQWEESTTQVCVECDVIWMQVNQ